MSTTNDPRISKPSITKQRPWPRRDGVFRFTVEQAYQLAELGFFDDRRVELIEGVLFETAVIPPHAVAESLGHEALRAVFGIGWQIRRASPIEVGRRSLPRPDLAVVAGSARDFLARHPTFPALVVEISDATLRKDRGLKAHLYAYAGIADYWIVNLRDRQLEVRRNPGPDPVRRGRFGYSEVTVVAPDGSMAPLAAPGSSVAVADLLP
jgi:Uma2 family endonuclease